MPSCVVCFHRSLVMGLCGLRTCHRSKCGKEATSVHLLRGSWLASRVSLRTQSAWTIWEVIGWKHHHSIQLLSKWIRLRQKALCRLQLPYPHTLFSVFAHRLSRWIIGKEQPGGSLCFARASMSHQGALFEN